MSSHEAAWQSLKGLHHGKVAIVISMGPSLSKFDQQELASEFANDEFLLFSIKGAHERVGANPDYVFANSFNLKKSYVSCPEKLIYVGHPRYPIFSNFLAYLETKYVKNSDLAASVAFTCEFESLEICEGKRDQEWGPGIMYEGVIPTLMHMGFRKIVTIGWDIADSSGFNTHFDDKQYTSGDNEIYNKFKSKRLTFLAFAVQIIPHCLFRAVRRFKYRKQFELGECVFPAAMQQGEAELLSGSIAPMRAWLERKGIEIDIRTNSTWMNKC